MENDEIQQEFIEICTYIYIYIKFNIIHQKYNKIGVSWKAQISVTNKAKMHSNPFTIWISAGSWLQHNGGVLQYVKAELSSLLAGVELRLPRWRQHLKILHQSSQNDT